MTGAPPLEPTIRSVLAVALHPDDLESWCAGTLARFIAQGARVAYLVITSGDKGSADPQARPGLVAMRREAEQVAAARLLGVRQVTFLRYPDGEVEDTPELRYAVARAVREHRPELVMTLDPWAPYTFHHDHREGSHATLAGVYPLAGRPGPLPTETGVSGPPPYAPREAWLFNTPRADRFVDVSDVAALKVAARLAHTSQVGDAGALRASFAERMRLTGAPANLSAAEAFRTVRFPDASRLDRRHLDH